MVQMSEQQHTGADDADPDAVVLHLAGVRARQHVNPLHRAAIEGSGIEMRPLRNIVEVAEPNGAEAPEIERTREPSAIAAIEGPGIEMRTSSNIAPTPNREETRFPVAPSNRSLPAVERRQARQAARQARQGDVHRIDIAARREERVSHSPVNADIAVCALPRGWREHQHPSGDGRVYYSNEHTRETTNAKPSLPAPPSGWKVHAHEERGHYFHNTSTNATQWHHPHDEAPEAHSTPNSASTTTNTVAPLPRGWREHQHPSGDGRVYYSNKHTRETTNTKPTLPAPPTGWKVCAHEERGHYFHNTSTNATQWHHPHDEAPKKKRGNTVIHM